MRVCACVCVRVCVCVCVCMCVPRTGTEPTVSVSEFKTVTPLRVWEPHCGAGVNILLENGQYPHNSSYEAPCLPWGVTREMDNGILVVES